MFTWPLESVRLRVHLHWNKRSTTQSSADAGSWGLDCGAKNCRANIHARAGSLDSGTLPFTRSQSSCSSPTPPHLHSNLIVLQPKPHELVLADLGQPWVFNCYVDIFSLQAFRVSVSALSMTFESSSHVSV